MRLGYNTNGFAHHDVFAAVEVLAALGYESIALALDHGPLNPFAAGFEAQLTKMRALLERKNLRCVIETGARYLLDPWEKHEPTLVSADPAGRNRRIAFLRAAVDAAVALNADCVSLWSGVDRLGASRAETLHRLVGGLYEIIGYAADKNIAIGFEPEPGMVIATVADYMELAEKLNHPAFQLTLDIGHLHCQGETPIAEAIRRVGSKIVNVHLEDMRSGVHEHLLFGEGEIDFTPIFAALKDIQYSYGVHVELSRHSHAAPSVAATMMQLLRKLRENPTDVG